MPRKRKKKHAGGRPTLMTLKMQKKICENIKLGDVA